MKLLSTYRILFKTIISILFFVLITGFFELSAQVTTLTNWTLHTHSTSTAATTSTVSVPTGSNSNRMLVVAIASSRTAVGIRTATLTYGGQTLALANGDFNVATIRQHSAIYYLDEAGLDAATNTTLSVTLGGGTTRINDVWYAVFDYVNQVSPLTNSRNYNSGTTAVNTFQYGTALNVNANNQAVEVISTVRNNNTGFRAITAPTNWTLVNEQTWTTTDGVRNAVATRTIPTTNITDLSSVILSGNALASMTGISLNNAPKYFRSVVTTGLWSSLATWEQSPNGTTGWVAATTLPLSSDAQVNIQTGHTITLNGATISPNLIVDGNLDLAANTLAGTGTLTGNNGSTITVGGTNNFPTGFTTTILNSGNTVNYDGTTQTVTSRNYANLTLSGSNAKTLQAGTALISGNLTLEGTATTTAVTGLTVSGNVVINSGTTFNGSTFTHNIAGNWTNNGGTFTTSTSTINFTGNSSSINGTAATQTFNNLTVNKTSAQTLSVSGNTTTLNVNGAFTQTTGNFSAPATMSVTGNTTLTAGVFTASTNLNLASNFTNNGATFTPGIGTVTFTGVTSAINGSTSTTFYNVTINKTAGNRQNLGANTGVNNILNLTSGILALSNFNFTFGANALAVQGSPSANNMIVATGTGRARKTFSTIGSFQLPIGEETGTAEYSPITITLNSATLAPGALVEAHVIDAKHPNDNSTTNFITRYWTVSQVGITNMTASIEADFAPADIVGTYQNIITSRYITPAWVEQNVSTATTLSAENLIAFGDFTGRNNLPIITVNTTTLTGFTYLEGFGPSAEQSFTVSGSALTTNITILPATNYEISFGSGASFVSSAILNAIVVNREVPTTTVYVRMKAGLLPGTIATQLISNSSTGVTAVNVSCSGTVTNAPLISTTVSALNNFSYTVGGGPSTAQSFNVSGTFMSSGITLTAPTNYEISLSASSGYGASLLLNQSGGNVASTPIYVRLKTGLLKGDYIENISLTATNALTKTVICSGKVNNPTVAVSKLTLAGFIYTNGAGPSDVQSVNVSGTFLAQNLTVTPPTNFEISTNATTGFALTPINIAPTSGTVASTPIFVRMKAGLGTGIIAAQNIVVTSGSAISQNVACSGQVVTGATTISSNGVFNGFMYVVNRGPSLKQNFTVSATSLTAPVTVTPPTNFEISLSGTEGTFVSNPSTLTIAQTGGKVNAIPVFVRLKAGYPVGTYNNQNIVLSSTGATNVNVVCNGTVVSQPTIVAGPTGLENLCPANNVTLTSSGTNITSQTWTGPNGFTSTAQNPVLGTVTASANGTYTVSSSIKSNINLLTNGDFSAGNSSFGSSYTFWPYGTQSYLQNQYTIGPNPATLNNGFCNQPSGRAGTGGNQMIIDGATLAAGGAGAIAWSQSIEIEEGATYQFSYWVQNIWPASPAILQFYIDGVPTGSVHNVTSTTCSWVQVTIPYKNTGTTRIVQLSLVDLNLIAQGNDFALDDFEFQLIFEVSSSVNLKVNPTLAPSLVVTASNNPVFANTIVTYTATPTNGGTTPSYQWKVNGVNQGSPTTSTTFDYTPVQGDSISCVLTSTYPCASPQTATNFVKMVVNPRTNYWRGNISTNWGTPANWTGGFVPAAGDDVEFAKKSNNNGVPAERNLQLDFNRTIGFLINDSAALSVIIPPNLTLIVNNSIQSGNNPDKVVVKASATLPNGSIVYRNSQSQPVFGTVEMYSPASWDLTKPINQKYNWQFFGIPVTSVPALPTFYGAYVRELFENDKDTATHWRSLKNESVLQPFIGYELCQQNANTLYTFKGQLVNSNYSSGRFIKTSDALYPGQHLFANPYTAAMDIKLIEFGAGVEATAYLYATGTFVQWRNLRNSIEGAIPGQYFAVPKNQAGIPGIPRQVPSMGTLMVRVPPASQSTELSYVTFNYNNIAMGNSERQRAKAASTTDIQATTTIEIEGENGADKMWIMSHENYTRNFDNGFDGKKLIGNALSPQLYAKEPDGNYQINSVNDINNTTLAFQAGQDTEYKMTFTHDENAQLKYKKVYLHDLVENKITDISLSGTSYNFTATSTIKPIIRFKVLSQSANENIAKTSNTKVYHFDNQLFVQNFSDFDGKVYVYDISGRTVGIKTISANQNIQIAAPKNNTYIVKIVVGSITETTKIFLQ